MFTNILLAYDHSENSQKAAVMAGGLARLQPQPQLHVITIVDPVSAQLGEPYFSQLIEKHKMAGEEVLRQAALLIGDGVEVTMEVLFGQVAQVIVNVAETRQCDIIVMGSRGLGAITGLLLGSQTHKVISLAHCPVLVVK